MFCKKIILSSLIALGAGTFIFGQDVASYLRTFGQEVRNTVKSNVSLDFEVKRAREMVENLIPEIHNSYHVISEQQVDVEYIEKEVKDKQSSIEVQEKAISKLNEDLKSGKNQFVYASHTYSSNEVKEDLAKRFERFKTAKKALEHDKKILEARKKTLLANEKQLNALLSSKKDLELKIEELDSRLKSLKAQESISTINIDNSQLTRAKKLIQDLNKQLDVKEKMLSNNGKFGDLIPVESKAGTEISTKSITEEIDVYFSSSKGEVKDIEADVEKETEKSEQDKTASNHELEKLSASL